MHRTLAGSGWLLALTQLSSACGFSGSSPTTLDAPDDGVPDPDAPDPGNADGPDERACAVGQAQCNGRDREVCNAAGSGFGFERSCGLTCGGDGACFEASNLPLAVQQACTATAPALSLPATQQARLVRTSPVTLDCGGPCSSGGASTLTAQMITQTDGPPMALFCVSTLAVAAGASIADAASTPGPSDAAIAFFVAGDVNVAGRITLNGRDGGITIAGRGGAGGFPGGGAANENGVGVPGGGTCPGNGGSKSEATGVIAGGGGGGGGHGGTGGQGGDGFNVVTASGGSGGGVCGVDGLVPLRGGSGGGGGADADCPEPCGRPGGGGGGALQIAATGQITITGTLHALGGAGATTPPGAPYRSASAGGGGGGGAILIESAQVAFTGDYSVRGGAGGSSAAGPGGDGGVSGKNGGNGTDQGGVLAGGAGGGGAAGRVRVHAQVAPACPVGEPVAGCTTGGLVATP